MEGFLCRDMSDGNFNRSMLPYRDFQSGLRAGKAQMRTLAVEAFTKWLKENHPEMDEGMISEKASDFKHMLE